MQNKILIIESNGNTTILNADKNLILYGYHIKKNGFKLD